MEYFPGESTMVTGMIFYEAYTNKEPICKELLQWNVLKFIYSEKATKLCEIFTLLLSYVVPVKKVR